MESKKKNDTNELIYKTEINSQTENKLGYQRQKRRGDKLGVCDEQIHTSVSKMDKGPL